MASREARQAAIKDAARLVRSGALGLRPALTPVPGPPIPCAFVMVSCGSQVLWGLRNGKQAAGIWGWPGGKADRPGTMAFNAAAELAEEVGLWVLASTLERIDAADEWIDAESGQSYPNTYFRIRISEAEKQFVEVREPDKHSEWSWFDVETPPAPAFPAELRIMRAAFA